MRCMCCVLTNCHHLFVYTAVSEGFATIIRLSVLLVALCVRRAVQFTRRSYHHAYRSRVLLSSARLSSSISRARHLQAARDVHQA